MVEQIEDIPEVVDLVVKDHEISEIDDPGEMDDLDEYLLRSASLFLPLSLVSDFPENTGLLADGLYG